MATFDSYLLGKARRSVGNITMCYMNKLNIAKAKIFKRKDRPTPEILMQRAKMKVLMRVCRQLLPVIRKGFAGIGQGSTSNAFMARNMNAVLVDDQYVATIDFEHLSLAEGLIYPPRVVVTYSSETKQYTFAQEKQELYEGYAFVDDVFYAVLFETELERARIVNLKNRGESGTTPYPLPEEWDATKVQAYSFATQKNGRTASKSVYLPIGE